MLPESVVETPQSPVSNGVIDQREEMPEIGLIQQQLPGESERQSHPHDLVLLAVGTTAVRSAARLQRHWARWITAGPPPEILATLPVADRSVVLRERLGARRSNERLGTADLVIAFVDGGGQWDPAIQLGPLLTRVPYWKRMVVDLGRTGASLRESAARAPARPSAFNVPGDSGRRGAGPDMAQRLFTGVAETVAASLIQPGVVCVDVSDYFRALGDCPGIARIGIGSAIGGDRAQAAVRQALQRLSAMSRNGGRVQGALAAVRLPPDGTLGEMEYVFERFRGTLGPDVPLVASCPVSPEDALFEVAFIQSIAVEPDREDTR